MTRTTDRAQWRSGLRACCAALVVLGMGFAASAAGASMRADAHRAVAHAKALAVTSTSTRHATGAKRIAAASKVKVRLAGAAVQARSEGSAELSLSDEFDRAELVERMLAECKGIPYNAFELAQTSGEALELPAPIQLMTVRVHHPYCAELLRTYAPKTRV